MNYHRDDDTDARLMRWAAWVNGGASASAGWPVKSVLHPSWMPPQGGGAVVVAAPSARSDGEERRTHAALAELSDKVLAAVVVWYLKPWPIADKAAALAVCQATLHARIAIAHTRLRCILARQDESAGQRGVLSVMG